MRALANNSSLARVIGIRVERVKGYNLAAGRRHGRRGGRALGLADGGQTP